MRYFSGQARPAPLGPCLRAGEGDGAGKTSGILPGGLPGTGKGARDGARACRRLLPGLLLLALVLTAASASAASLTSPAASPTGSSAASQAAGPTVSPAASAAPGPSPQDIAAASAQKGHPSLLPEGSQSTLDRSQMRVWGLSLCVIGCMLTMSLYHLALFALRKRPAYLYFAFICLFWAGFFLTGDFTQWAISAFIPSANPLLLYQIHMSFFLLSRPFGYRFLLALYPQEFSRFFRHVSDAIPLVFGAILWTDPALYASRGLAFAHAVTACIVVYSLWRLVACVRHRREGAHFILFGYGAGGILGVYRMLHSNGVPMPLSSPSSGTLMMLGSLLYVLSQALALVQQYANTFTRVHNLSATLQESNLALRREAAERNRLERRIVNISEEERRRLSSELHDGLCQHLTAARLRCAILEDQLADGPSAEELAQLSVLLDASVDGAYGLSRGLWPVEPDPKTPGPSLQALVRSIAETSGIAVELRQELRCGACVNPNAVHLYRIAQEALVNAVKHAKASRIQVSLCCAASGRLSLSVVDNGIGRAAATASQGGLGLEIMAHRAGVIEADLEITDASGGGTAVRCVAPCTACPSPAPNSTA